MPNKQNEYTIYLLSCEYALLLMALRFEPLIHNITVPNLQIPLYEKHLFNRIHWLSWWRIDETFTHPTTGEPLLFTYPEPGQKNSIRTL